MNMRANAESYIANTKYILNANFISGHSQALNLVSQRMMVQKIKPYCPWTPSALAIENKVLAISKKGWTWSTPG